MASTSSYFYKDSQNVLDAIDYQLTLDPNTLVGLVKAFLDEFRMGLSNYNFPMAMMYAYVSFLRYLRLTFT